MRHTHLYKDSPIAGVDHRGIHRARPGHAFIICDSRQIEPRCINYLAGNWTFLEACRKTSVYQAAAIADGVWSMERGDLRKEDPILYALKKADTLARGFGAGHIKFIDMAPGYIQPLTVEEVLGTDVTPEQLCSYEQYLAALDSRKKSHAMMNWYKALDSEEKQRLYCRSWILTNEWRQRNPRILRLWNKLEDAFRLHADNREEEFQIILPSGRPLHFYKPQKTKFRGEVKLAAYRTQHPKRKPERDLKFYYGGALAQAATQAFARDVFCWQCVQVVKAGIPIIFTVHDELVAEVPESQADSAFETVQQIMKTSPPWASRLPVDCEGCISERYKK